VIVRAVDDGLQLITQPDHAHLARVIMAHCTSLGTRERRDAILLAIDAHDNGWAEEDAAPTINAATGNVVDFVEAPLSVRHAVWPRAVARLSHDPWAAALVAQHAITAYERFRADAAWAAFFAEMEALRDQWMGAAGLPLEDLLADYVFVRVGDLISLVFCTGWTQRQQFGPWTVQLAGARVIVAPDLFGGAAIPIAIDAKQVGQRTFKSDAELRRSLADAPTVTVHGQVAANAD
jgi:hypothetical protein